MTTVRETLRTEIPATASVEVARFGFLSGGEVRVRTRDVEPANANVWALSCPLGVVGSPIEAAGTGAVACEDTITTVYVGRKGCVAMRMTPGSETARVVGSSETRENMPAAEDDDATEALDEDDDDDDARPSGVRRASNRSEIYIS